MLCKSILFCGFLFFSNAYAICVENMTDDNLYYEIQNKNMGCPAPKVKFHSGTLNPHQKACYDHNSKSSDDWRIYRKDDISVFKIGDDGSQRLVCHRKVEGILNLLSVSYTPNYWWCLDASDYEDVVPAF